jgi:hypothetical protein
MDTLTHNYNTNLVPLAEERWEQEENRPTSVMIIT